MLSFSLSLSRHVTLPVVVDIHICLDGMYLFVHTALSFARLRISGLVGLALVFAHPNIDHFKSLHAYYFDQTDQIS